MESTRFCPGTLFIKIDKGWCNMALTFYWYPKCGTCRKAKKWLDEHGIAVREVHIVENPPTKEELTELYRKSGLPLKKFFNTTGMKYRQLGLKDKVNTASEEELLELLASDGMLIKRPILTDGNRVIVGFSEEQYEKFFKQ
jgi:arsenate reductase